MNKFFSIVFASFNTRAYIEMGKLRIEQMRRQHLKFFFIVNGAIPAEIDLREGEYYIEECLDKELKWGPEVLQMLLHLFYTVPEFEKFDYIIRSTSTIYINYKNLPRLLNELPKTNYVGGHLYPYKYGLFCAGTVIVMSKDVAKYYANDLILDKQLCKTEPDDVTISHSLNTRYILHDLGFSFIYYEHFTNIPEVDEIITKLKDESVFLRINNNRSDREKVDPFIWRTLDKYIGL